MQLWLALPNEGICLHVQYKYAALQPPPNRLQGRTNTQAVLVPVIMLSFFYSLSVLYFLSLLYFHAFFCCLYFSVLLLR